MGGMHAGWGPGEKVWRGVARTTQRASAGTASAAADSCAMSSALNAFFTAGRVSVIRATRRSSTTRRVSSATSSPDANDRPRTGIGSAAHLCDNSKGARRMDIERLKGLRVAIIVTDDFEQIEMVDPRKLLVAAGADTTLIAPKPGVVQGMKHDDKADTVHVEMLLADADPEQLDPLPLPASPPTPA